ncbi:MAG: hypothetical protein H6898_02940 [Rhodobacter sp.]|nr:hypothetical protein [Rhodobacter sp.]
MPRLEPLIRSFARSESGAVTVDWTVLAAALCGLGLASAAAVRTGVGDLGAEVGTALSSASVAVLSFGGDSDSGWIPLSYTAERFAELTDIFSEYSDDSLESTYASYLLAVEYALSTGDLAGAAVFLDAAAAAVAAAAARGPGISDQGAGLNALLETYIEATA